MRLKRKINRYRLGQWTQYLTYFVLVVLLVLVGMKTVRIAEKVVSVNKAVALYDEEKWLEAETALQSAKANDWFLYKEKKIDELLINLNWITNYRVSLKNIQEELAISQENMDYSSFRTQCSLYEQLHIENLADWQQVYLEEQFHIEQAENDGWQYFKEEMESVLENPVDNDLYTWAKQSILEVPDKYFEGEKIAYIEALFASCDHILLQDIYGKNLAFEELINTINEIYDFNGSCGFSTDWLTDEVRQYIDTRLVEGAKPLDEAVMSAVRSGNPQYSEAEKAVLLPTEEMEVPETGEVASDEEAIDVPRSLALAAKDIECFVKMLKKYDDQSMRPYYHHEGIEMTTQYITEKENEIQTLIQYQYYDEAIAWYEAMNYFKDYAEEIAFVRSIKEYDAPWSLLDEHTQYPVYITGENALGAQKYMLAFNHDQEEVELDLIEGTRDVHTIHKISVKFSDINLSGAMLNDIRTIDINGQLIAIKAVKEQKQYIWLLELKEDTVSLIFDKQGETITYPEDLKKVVIENPTDEPIPNTYTYVYEQEGYVKEDSKPIVIDLGSGDILNYMGHQVTFNCYVPEIASGNPATGYAYDAGSYFQQAFVQLSSSDNTRIESGFYKVVGQMVGTISCYDQTVQGNVDHPIITVTQLEKQEGNE